MVCVRGEGKGVAELAGGLGEAVEDQVGWFGGEFEPCEDDNGVWSR